MIDAIVLYVVINIALIAALVTRGQLVSVVYGDDDGDSVQVFGAFLLMLLIGIFFLLFIRPVATGGRE